METTKQRIEREAAIRQHVEKQRRALERSKTIQSGLGNLRALSRSGDAETGVAGGSEDDPEIAAEAEELEAEDEARTLWVGNMPAELLQLSTLRMSRYDQLGGNEYEIDDSQSPKSIDGHSGP